MDRYIILNGVLYKVHEVSSFNSKSMNSRYDLKEANPEPKRHHKALMKASFTSIYNGHTVDVLYAEIKCCITLEVYYDETHKMIITLNSITIGLDMDPNVDQLWTLYNGVWYKVCGNPLDIINRITDACKTKEKDSVKSNKKSVINRGTKVFTSMYTNDQISVKAYANTTGDVYVYNFKKDGVYFKHNPSTIWKEKNGTEWIEYGGLFYLVCRDQKLIDKFEKSINQNTAHAKKNNEVDKDVLTIRNPYNGNLTKLHYQKYNKKEPVVVYTTDNKCHSFIPEYIGTDENNCKWASDSGKWYLINTVGNCTHKKNQMETTEVNVQKLNTQDKNCRIWNEKSIQDLVSKKYIFSVRNIMANMAKWIYALDPINLTSNYPVHNIYIRIILHEFYLTLIKDGKKIYDSSNENFYYFEYTRDELKKYLYFLVYDCPNTKNLFSKLNLSYNEIQNEIDVSDPNRESVTFSSRYSGPKWEDDFIDLDALINNIVRDCVRDATEVES